MLKVISFTICPFVQRVTALLESRSVPYEIEYISLSNKPDWFLEISPAGQVPVLMTESGTALFESDAIVEYLNEVHPDLSESITPEQRALDRAWSYQASKHYLTQCSAMRSTDQQTLTERSNKLGAAFSKVEQVLGSNRYFRGDVLSNVDIAWLPLLHRADIIRRYTGYDFLEQYPKVRKWQNALMETGLAEKSVSEDFEKKFTEFYLSHLTWLGAGSRCSKPEQSCSDLACC